MVMAWSCFGSTCFKLKLPVALYDDGVRLKTKIYKRSKFLLKNLMPVGWGAGAEGPRTQTEGPKDHGPGPEPHVTLENFAVCRRCMHACFRSNQNACGKHFSGMSFRMVGKERSCFWSGRRLHRMGIYMPRKLPPNYSASAFH